MKKLLILPVLLTVVSPGFAVENTNNTVLYGDANNVVKTKVDKTKLDKAEKKVINKIDDTKKSANNIKKETEVIKKENEIKKSEIEKVSEIKQEAVVEQKSVATANDSKTKFPNGAQFGLGLSVTSGVNGFVGYVNKDFDSFWWKRIGGRLDFATTSPIKSVLNSAINNAVSDGKNIGDDGGVTINSASLSANHFAALVDFYPFGDTWFLGGLRLTGGYMLGKLDLRASLASEIQNAPGGVTEFELNDVKYRYNSNTMNGTADAKWKYSGPYVGTGFDLGLLWGVKIFMDAGVVFTGKTPSVDLDVPVTDMLQYWNGSSWDNVKIDSDLTNQFENNKNLALKDANEELDKYKMFPIVKLGLMYRF